MSERLARVTENVKETVSLLIERKIKDPRIELVTITGVDISGDLRHCKVFFSTLGGKAEHDRALEGLESASGYVRRELGKRLRMKYTPGVRFYFDESVEQGERIDKIITRLKAEEREE